jgi:hypothetical protein
MPNINIAVSEDLLTRIRVHCAAHGLTQKQVVVDALTVAFPVIGGDAVLSPDDQRIKKLRESTKPRDIATVAAVLRLSGREHDQKTCRVYKCGVCAADELGRR